MEKKIDDVVTVPEERKPGTGKGIGRRRLLKTLIASGGVVALTGLPNKWSKPVVEAGELSAHAMASPVGDYRIADLVIGRFPENGAGGQADVAYAHFTYYDAAKLVAEVPGTVVQGRTDCQALFPDITGINPEYATEGTVEFMFDVPLCNSTTLTPTLYAQLKSAGRTSNEISAPLLTNATTRF